MKPFRAKIVNPFAKKAKVGKKIIATILSLTILVSILSTSASEATSKNLGLSEALDTTLLDVENGGNNKSQQQVLDAINDGFGATTYNQFSSISSLEELVEFGQSVNSGNDHSGVAVKLEGNINITDDIQWISIGTEANPFRGIFDGNEFVISGLGGNDLIPLFGYVEDAALQNITIKTKYFADQAAPYAVLVKSAVNTSFNDCSVEQAQETYARFLASTFAVDLDDSWKSQVASSTGASPVAINTPAKLWSLAREVSAGSVATSGAYFKLVVNMADQPTDAWVGIGTETNPFEGFVVDSKIENLVAYQPGINNVGLFGYTLGATFDNVSVVNGLIAGGKNVGALVGYAQDTQISNSTSSGDISGTSGVGGLVGEFHVVDSADTPYRQNIINSYSTADILGSADSIGGIAGRVTMAPDADYNTDYQLDTVFSSGSISGFSGVGGIVGYLGKATGGTGIGHVKVINGASSSTIRASVNSGGIVGITEFSWDKTMGGKLPFVSQSYFAGILEGITNIGGIVGMALNGSSYPIGVKDSYVSGYVIAPNASEGDYVWAISGFENYAQSNNVVMNPNTVYNLNNPMNADTTNSAYKKGELSYDSDYQFFGEPPSIVLPGFTTHDVQYAGTPAMAVVGGQYPTLTKFTGSSSTAFRTFSEASTKIDGTEVPSVAYTNPSDLLLYKVSNHTAGMEIMLASGEWKIREAGSMTTSRGSQVVIFDEALEKNITISIVGNNIKLSDMPASKLEIILTGTASGINYTYNLTIADQSVAPIEGGIDSRLYLDPRNILAFLGTEGEENYKISKNESAQYINFGEKIMTPSGNTILIEEFNDATFSGAPVSTSVVTAEIIKSTSLSLQWDKTYCGNSKFYRIDLAPLLVSDTNGNRFDPVYYFASMAVGAPVLSFTDHSLADPSSTATNQTIVMTESSNVFTDILQSVYVESENNIDLYAGQTEKLAAVTATIGGKEGYDPITVAMADIDKILSVPGTYVVEYQVTDPVNGTVSNIIRRTFKVKGNAVLMQGDSNYKLLTAQLSSDEMVAIYNDYESTKLTNSAYTVAEAVNKALNVKFVTSATSSNKLTAYYYDETASRQLGTIAFGVNNSINESNFWDGSDSNHSFYVNLNGYEEKHTFMLSLDSLESTYEIRVDNASYIAVNTLVRYKAKNYINARVFNKTTNSYEKDMRVFFDFRDIDPYKYDLAQEVELTLDKYKKKNIIAGKDLTVKATVSIIIQKTDEYKDPRDKANIAQIFWEESSNMITTRAGDKTYDFNMDMVSAEYASTDFFINVANQKDVTAVLKYPNDIQMTFNTSSIDKARISTMKVDLTIERMYDMYIGRDAGGYPTYQFATGKNVNLPGIMTFTMPLDKALIDSGDLSLYYLDDVTGNYTLMANLTEQDFSGNAFIYKAAKLNGRYIITAADLDGLKASTNVEIS